MIKIFGDSIKGIIIPTVKGYFKIETNRNWVHTIEIKRVMKNAGYTFSEIHESLKLFL